MSSQPTGIALNAKQFILFVLYSIFPLIVEVDGVPSKGTWGDQFINLAPGQHSVTVAYKLYWVLPCNKGSINVTVNPGEVVALKYKMRLFFLLPGKLSVVAA